MEKKKRIVSKLIFALVIAVIVSMCFVGTTLARYASGSNGSASTQIALWDINFSGESYAEEEYTGTVDNLSPSMDAYSADTGTARTHSTAIKVLTIENAGEVDASVYFTFDGTETLGYNSSEPVWEANWTDTSTTDIPSKQNVTDLFDISFYYTTNDMDAEAPGTGAEDILVSHPGNYTKIQSGDANAITLKAKGDGSDSKINVYVFVTWTSADATLKGNADKLDTWVGENIASVSYTFSVTAVQGSEAPATT